jgi:hypothetical protein
MRNKIPSIGKGEFRRKSLFVLPIKFTKDLFIKTFAPAYRQAGKNGAACPVSSFALVRG